MTSHNDDTAEHASESHAVKNRQTLDVPAASDHSAQALRSAQHASDFRRIWPDLREDEESSLGIVSSPGMHSEILGSEREQTGLPLMSTCTSHSRATAQMSSRALERPSFAFMVIWTEVSAGDL